MFFERVYSGEKNTLLYREEDLTGHSCRISPERIERGIDHGVFLQENAVNCPFCPELREKVTPVFPKGDRIKIGESLTFPNLFPFSLWHTVTIVSSAHTTSEFSQKQISDALSGQFESLKDINGFPSINWNYLPSAGASILHSHMQGICDPRPTQFVKRYLSREQEFFWKHGFSYSDYVIDHEVNSSRFLFGDEIFWYAHPVPVGEREIRALLPFSHLSELHSYLDTLASGVRKIIEFYKESGSFAFNMSIFFDSEERKNCGFNAFLSMIARINPSPAGTSDSAYMERLHNEPVIMTLPEDLGRSFKG